MIALVISALVGGNVFGLRERFFGSETPERKTAAVGRTAPGAGAAPIPAQVPTTVPPETVVRSQPWWQRVATVEDAGAKSHPVTIADGAVQWRVGWSCQTGQLSVTVPGRPRPVVDARCPGHGTGYSTRTGHFALDVRAGGPYRLDIEQQLDVPLVEPPLPAMAAPGTAKVATGSLYGMDQTGYGTATFYRLADGSHALRLDEFFVTANVDLELTLSPLEAPKTTKEFMDAPFVFVAPLDITAGSMNFAVPADVDPTRYRSLVVWCPLIDRAYAAATLGPVG
ncbi:MAG TPA: DM13 domain-containing protein [Acidimicrobiales bacterium]|nr:DM13 domain-containing protein [Acidimicrobiales bacterium]